MKKGHYNWEPTGPPPIIKQHSIAKHEILRSYLTAYIQTLLSSMQRRDVFRLTLIDGFAGGGIYRHADTSDEVIGSPLIMIEAVKEAEVLVNLPRQHPVKFEIDYFFVEKHRGAYESLTRQLQIQGHGHFLGQNIHLFNDKFHNVSDKIKQFVKLKSPRSPRAIFLLDQYGFLEVPTTEIREIFNTVPGAEIILTFAVGAFLTYASDDELTEKKKRALGVPNFLKGMSIKEIKRKERYWRLFIQSCLYPDLVTACGARYFTPFFIRSQQGHGDYWLIHLSQKPRARDVMTRIHWEQSNYFIHYGDPGLEMFRMPGYIPSLDDEYRYSLTGQPSLGFEFGAWERQLSIQTIAEQIPDLVYAERHGVTFGDVFAATCNGTPAHTEIYKEAAGILLKEKDIEIISKDGRRRESPNRIHDTDRLLRPAQMKLFT